MRYLLGLVKAAHGSSSLPRGLREYPPLASPTRLQSRSECAEDGQTPSLEMVRGVASTVRISASVSLFMRHLEVLAATRTTSAEESTAQYRRLPTFQWLSD